VSPAAITEAIDALRKQGKRDEEIAIALMAAAHDLLPEHSRLLPPVAAVGEDYDDPREAIDAIVDAAREAARHGCASSEDFDAVSAALNRAVGTLQRLDPNSRLNALEALSTLPSSVPLQFVAVALSVALEVASSERDAVLQEAVNRFIERATGE
jgi:ABC-type transporter Mla subunit MlaD